MSSLPGTPVYIPRLTVSHHPCRYVVDVRWMKQWKKFVGYDTWDRSQVGEDSANPGPIDNKSLLAGEGLCVHVFECMCGVAQYLPSSESCELG